MTTTHVIPERRPKEMGVKKPETLEHQAKPLVEGQILKIGPPSEIAIVPDRQAVPIVESLVEPTRNKISQGAENHVTTFAI